MFNFFRKKSKDENKETIKEYKEDFENVTKIAEFFYKETGITFDKQLNILKSKVILFCGQRNIRSFSDLLEKIKSDKTLKQELIDLLTVNETYFYREMKQIEKLVKFVKQENYNIRILCAPCATGEEPYSIAIALLESGVSGFHIVGIDINAEAIQKAKEAVYNKKSIRNLSSEILNKYFKIENDKYILKDNVKSLVSFQVANIFDDSFKTLGKFDFVFSRNMLIYFDKETKQKAKKILEDMRKNDKYDVFFGHADLF
jgi:chemotaxis protein methyltransferase CheR